VPELHIENLSKAYGPRRVLRNLSCAAQGGEVLGVLGANGSGKSTLLKIVAGLLRPTTGTVTLTVQGRTVSDSVERRRSIAYSGPDVAFYPELSARENLCFFATVAGWQSGIGEIGRYLKRVGLEHREDDPVVVYSSGMKQRLRLAFALLSSAEILLLDEPSLALDTEGVRLVHEIIQEQRNQGRLVVLATNDPTERCWADRTISVSTLAAEGVPRVLGE
jgi:heme ABC exporter ATP-binding subunit CcmA